ncbi:MAG: hypothetical protein ACRDJX_06300 [Solirubrobacteraceae bacterium]
MTLRRFAPTWAGLWVRDCELPASTADGLDVIAVPLPGSVSNVDPLAPCAAEAAEKATTGIEPV